MPNSPKSPTAASVKSGDLHAIPPPDQPPSVLPLHDELFEDVHSHSVTDDLTAKVHISTTSAEDQESNQDNLPMKLTEGAWIVPMKVKIIAIVLMLALAVLLTFTAPRPSADPYPWNYISAFVGWTYFLAWGISFVPQIYINWRRRSVEGQSLDFVALNTLGFSCYTVYNTCFYGSSAIQRDYRGRHNGKGNTVELNDVVFAYWALTMCILNGVQAFFFAKPGHRVHMIVRIAIAVLLVLIFIWLIVAIVLVKQRGPDSMTFFNYLDFLYGLSMIKLGVSLAKYLPQIYMNFRRKLTLGWSIENCLLDFTGGILSVGQTVMDSAVTDNWGGITGNPVKFFLGCFSMIYDCVFFTQHYFLYAANNKKYMEEKMGHAAESAGTAPTEGDNATLEEDDEHRSVSVLRSSQTTMGAADGKERNLP